MSKIDTELVGTCLREAVTGILATTVELEVQGRPLHKEAQPIHMDDGVTVIVGVTGELEGSFTLSLSEAFAIRYTCRLLEIDQTEYDEVVASAIGELGNMVSAQATMLLHDKGILCDLCPPTILRSKAAELTGPQAALYALEFDSDWGRVLAHIFLRQTTPPPPPGD